MKNKTYDDISKISQSLKDLSNYQIEFDGIQHYKPVIFGGRNTPDAKTKAEQQYKDGLYRDELKNIYCQKHNIKLIRIPYYDLDRIEEILDRELEVG